MKKITLILSILIFLTSSAVASTRYVSDDLFTYVHSGPGTKYKIIGSVDAGDKIKLIEIDQTAGYAQIKDTKDRIGWINSKYISKRPGLKVRSVKLETQLAKLNTQLAIDKEKVKSHSIEVTELKNTNERLTAELQRIQVLNDELNEVLDTERVDLLMRWFTYGGIVAGVGLFLGLILPSLMPNRRKRSNW